MSACLQLSVESAPENVRLVRRTVAAAAADAGADTAAACDIALAVNEAVANAVRHAYAPEVGSVYVSIERYGSSLAVVVRDDGCGFIPAEATRDGGDGGFGLRLMERLTRHFVVRSVPDRGTEVRMVFALRGRA